MQPVQPEDHEAPPPRHVGPSPEDQVQEYLEQAGRVCRLVQVDWTKKDGYVLRTWNYGEADGVFSSYHQFSLHGPSHPPEGMLQSIMWLFKTAADAATAVEHNASFMLEEHNHMRKVDVSSFARLDDAVCSADVDKLRSLSTAVLASRTSSRTPMVFCDRPRLFARCIVTQLGGAVIKTYLSHRFEDAATTTQGVVRAALESLERQRCFMQGAAWHPRVEALVAELLPLAASVHELDGLRVIPPPAGSASMELLFDVLRQTIVDKLGAAFPCAACGKVPTRREEALLCGKCRTTSYCSKTCQAGHWKVHKPACHVPAV